MARLRPNNTSANISSANISSANMYDKIKNSIPSALVGLINSEVVREDVFIFPHVFIGSSKKKVN